MKASEKERIIHAVTQEIYEAYPFLWEKFGQKGWNRTIEDNQHHLDHLATAYQMNDETFFMDYTSWLQRVLTNRNIGTELIIDNFERLSRHLEQLEDQTEKKAYQTYLASGLDALKVRENEGV